MDPLDVKKLKGQKKGDLLMMETYSSIIKEIQ